MNTASDPLSAALADLGWSAFFTDQLTAEDDALVPMRIATVHRARLTAESGRGPVRLILPIATNTADYAVGDWALVEPDTNTLIRRLNRQSLLERHTEGARVPQLIAANVDTLFIATSCNDDLNPARLERYLALAAEAGTKPVIVLTKADQVPDIAPYRDQVTGLQRDLPVVAVNTKSPETLAILAPWCASGQTIAIVGSSGVGKSSLLNTLAAKTGEDAQLTGEIRESDAKGRHTTTSRSLHAIATGGWVIDTPGIRTLHVSDIAAGLGEVFAEITELAPNCRFRNCTHAHEPGCAVQAAVKAGELDSARLARWRKLTDENTANTPVQTGPRGNKITKVGGKKR
ncbi:ribosome small subunit-dependent GTPase A [Neogemmobacter tilapiae]|uniref:Small ribosomal subunit biogenesis GTPase RsgA n=1 Tax=Neogemmobacter tilapiae TaxID=875041 RepID=A0A918TJ45_9RHOB|nr:ribosome small subunit-dependent GTPase A [Gemmobacter tilapiae]GHC50363.1 putative ribosome biogenesis GTPase RsgA [Gemmobacter tilapiae]